MLCLLTEETDDSKNYFIEGRRNKDHSASDFEDKIPSQKNSPRQQCKAVAIRTLKHLCLIIYPLNIGTWKFHEPSAVLTATFIHHL